MAAKNISQVSTGARVIFKVNGAPLLYANAVSYSVEHNQSYIDVLDQLEPVEYAETSYRVSFSCTMFRVSYRDAVSLGIRPKLQDIVVQPELTAELTDSVTGQTLMLLERVKCTKEDFSIDSRSMGQVTLNFVAIKLSTEAGA